MLTPEQCRAARGLLDWSRKELADASGVAERTIVNFETGVRRPMDRTLRDLVEALEKAGVELIAKNGGGPGVRLRQP